MVVLSMLWELTMLLAVLMMGKLLVLMLMLVMQVRVDGEWRCRYPTTVMAGIQMLLATMRMTLAMMLLWL